MKYKGRIIFSAPIAVFTIAVTIYEYFFYNILEAFAYGIMGALAIVLSWYLGGVTEKLHESNKELNAIFNNADSFIWSIYLIKQKLTVSKGIELIFGFPSKKFEDRHDFWITRTLPEDSEIVHTFYNNLISGKHDQAQWRFIRSDGEVRWLESRGSPIFDNNGKLIKSMGVAYDITEEKENEEVIREIAFHDALTGLPNRYKLNDLLQKALVHSKQNNTILAVMFLDLDRFKFINDTKGHNVGDLLLNQVAERLSGCIREGDIVARQGGDEFIILLENIKKSQAKEISQGILDSFKQPFRLNEEEFYSSTSIGISFYPEDGQDSETLIKNADYAMYVAKGRGKNNYQFFVPEPEEVFERKVKLEQGFRRALRNEEFLLHYQPQVELSTGECIGVEALTRWKHPEFGMVGPNEFIPIAEETGMIVKIGEWAIEEACKQIKAWHEHGLPLIKVAVNVSAIQILDLSFVKVVKQVLDKYQVEPKFLELELTESIMQNIKVSSAVLVQLKEIGVKISIDDFGTGYSSLSVLNRLPIDRLKIDRSFINEVTTNLNTASLVKTIIGMGSNLKMELIAEGIEYNQQAEFLLQNGCRFGQGYMYSPPIPAEEIERLVEKQIKPLHIE